MKPPIITTISTSNNLYLSIEEVINTFDYPRFYTKFILGFEKYNTVEEVTKFIIRFFSYHMPCELLTT